MKIVITLEFTSEAEWTHDDLLEAVEEVYTKSGIRNKFIIKDVIPHVTATVEKDFS